MTRLEQLHSATSEPQRKVLTEIWNYFSAHKQWMPVRLVHNTFHGKSNVWPLLQQLGGSIVFETEDGGVKYYQLTLLGVLLGDTGQACKTLLARYLGYAIQKSAQEPLRTTIRSQEVMADLGINMDEVSILGQLILLGQFQRSGSFSDKEWSAAIPDNIQDLPNDLGIYVGEYATRQYDMATPVAVAERYQHLISHQKERSQAGTSDATFGPASSGQSSPNTISEQRTRAYELDSVWGPLRAVLENSFTFSKIKEIVGLAGVPMASLAHLQQVAGGFTSKGQLMTALDGALKDMAHDERRRFITIATEEVLRRQPSVSDTLGEYLSRLGWTILEGKIIPLEILDVSELPELPEEARADIAKASQRLRDGDLSGAVSAACGAVDSTTSRIYKEKSLGVPGRASFQERVSMSLNAQGTFSQLEQQLQALGWPEDKIKPFKESLTKSIVQAAYVMQTLRSNMGDVHGSKPVLKPLVFDSIKWASIITRLLT